MKKKQMRVMDFITRERVYRFPNECGKSTLAKFLHSYFLKRWLILFWLHLKSELIRGVAIKVIMQQSWHSKAKTKKFVMLGWHSLTPTQE